MTTLNLNSFLGTVRNAECVYHDAVRRERERDAFSLLCPILKDTLWVFYSLSLSLSLSLSHTHTHTHWNYLSLPLSFNLSIVCLYLQDAILYLTLIFQLCSCFSTVLCLKKLLSYSQVQLVVYFDQRLGAPHAVRWSKSIFFSPKTTFCVILCYFLHYFILKRTFYD